MFLWILTKTFFGLTFSVDVDDEILFKYQENLTQEIDFLTIYGGVSLLEAYSIPTVRRKIFINNYNYFKDIERKEMEKASGNNSSDSGPAHRPNFDKISFK